MSTDQVMNAIYKAFDNSKCITVVVMVNGCTICENESITGCTKMCYSKALMLSNGTIMHYIDKAIEVEIIHNSVTINIEL